MGFALVSESFIDEGMIPALHLRRLGHFTFPLLDTPAGADEKPRPAGRRSGCAPDVLGSLAALQHPARRQYASRRRRRKGSPSGMPARKERLGQQRLWRALPAKRQASLSLHALRTRLRVA